MLRDSPTRRKPSEDGYILIGVILLLVLFVIAMAVAAPRIAASIQRDREVETMHRGKQYIRAIQLYYRKFNAYPPNLDALVKTSEIRFLRKRYIDPMTGKDDWKPITFGQNKTPMAMGFFGQPLGGAGMGGAVVAGTGPSGTTNGITDASALSSPASSPGLVNTSSSPAGAAGVSSGTPGGSGAFSSSASSSPAGPIDANGNPISGVPGQNSGSTTGQTFGGAGIIGVSPASPKQSILVYKKKNHYNEWEFLYTPLMEQQMMAGGNAGTIGQPAGGTPVAPGSTGQSINQSFGPAGNSGSTPMPPAPAPVPGSPNQQQ